VSAARAAHLDFVPLVFAATHGNTSVTSGDRLWDLTSWLPGRATCAERPSPTQVAAACISLARLHTVWSRSSPTRGPCPAVQRRLACVQEWLALVHSGWRPNFDARQADPVRPWAERAWRALLGRIECIPAQLAPWTEQVLPLQLCLCDVWQAHVLYEG